MGTRYQTIVAELAERAPELASVCQPEIETFLESCQRGADNTLSSEDLEYLRTLQQQNPHDLVDHIEQPLTYLVFENELMPFLVELVQNPEKHRRLQEIMNWLEELAMSNDFDVRNLVAISIGENLITNESKHLPAFMPFIGENLRNFCRELLPSFRVSEQIRQLLN